VWSLLNCSLGGGRFQDSVALFIVEVDSEVDSEGLEREREYDQAYAVDCTEKNVRD
jgi:hypothetical protein